MAGTPPSLPLQARTQLLSPVLDGSKGWALLYGQGERLRNPANHVLAIPEWICFQCSAGGVWGGTQPPLESKPIPNVLVQLIGLALCQAGAETLDHAGTE